MGLRFALKHRLTKFIFVKNYHLSSICGVYLLLPIKTNGFYDSYQHECNKNSLTKIIAISISVWRSFYCFIRFNDSFIAEFQNHVPHKYAITLVLNNLICEHVLMCITNLTVKMGHYDATRHWCKPRTTLIVSRFTIKSLNLRQCRYCKFCLYFGFYDDGVTSVFSLPTLLKFVAFTSKFTSKTAWHSLIQSVIQILQKIDRKYHTLRLKANLEKGIIINYRRLFF